MNQADAHKTAFDRVRLRPVVEPDFPALYEFQADPESARMAVVNPRSRAEFDTHWRGVLQNPSIIARAITLDDALVGSISRFPRDGLDYVGYWIARSHWGQGIASQALKLLLREVTTRPLHARAASSNLASIRVLQRRGFVITGRQFAPATDRFPACEETVFVLA
jgi:RimJ/RimL family protein N-acetyltransferase